MVKYSAADMENGNVTVVVEAPGLANFTGAIEVQVPVDLGRGNILVAAVNSLRISEEVPEMTSEK